MRLLRRCMTYGRALKERQPDRQRDMFHCLGFSDDDILLLEARAGVLKPSHVLLRDQALRRIVLAIRGTQTIKVRSRRARARGAAAGRLPACAGWGQAGRSWRRAHGRTGPGARA
jgi:hypothetical protein